MYTKSIGLGRKISNTVDAFAATFMERFTGVIALGMISIAALFKFMGWWGILIFVGFWIAFFIGLKTLKLLGNKFKKLQEIYESLILYKSQNKVLAWSFITSLIIQFIAIATQYVVFLAIGVKLPIAFSLFIFPIITLAGFFIPSLNGVGVQDALYMQFFLTVGVAGPVSLSASVLYHLFRLGTSLIGGVLYATGKGN
ncbi:lysylphosphatidylglycerol synthase domain-containing protein [Patescibacteria group bacterium]